MPTRVETDIKVQRFAFADDVDGRRLIFPRAELQKIGGRTGGVSYGVEDSIFDGLEGRLDTVRWTSDAASLGSAWIRDDSGRFEIEVDRIELSRGLMLTKADSGMELVSPHLSLSEMRLTVTGPFGRSDNPAPAPASPPNAPATLRQDRLRFLDSLSGRINLTVKVVLDLPVIKRRTLDQHLEVPITEGSLDYRALENSLDWLEGAFLDIRHEKDTLALKWKVPIFGSRHELIAWKLDAEAETMATFGRVPVRSLADVRRKVGRDTQPGVPVEEGRKTLQSLTVEAIDIVLSLLAPRSLEVGGGVIMFGGEGEPGMVDLKVTGSVSMEGPGALNGAIGSIDTTIKDLRMGPVLLTADRLHFDGLDQLEVTFDGFRPSKVTMVVHRVTATNLSLRLGGQR